MIVEMYKYVIFGSRQDMDHFFALAQRAGFIEFINASKRRALNLPEKAKAFLSAIRIAKHYPTHPKEIPATELSIGEIAEKIVQMKSEQETLFEEERVLTAEIARIAVFGDFSRQELDALEQDSRRIFQFFCMKSDLAKGVLLPPELIHVGTDYDLDYFVSIARDKIQYPKMIEIVIEKPVGELRARLLEVRETLAKLESDLRIFANMLPALQEGLTELLDDHHLQMAKNGVSLNLQDSLFIVGAWVPKTKAKSLKALLSTLNVECEQIAIEKADKIPTCIENRGAAKIGEDILQIFDTPSHQDKDPSLWILCFFALFFSMIVADAGYGLVFLILSLILKWALPNLHGIPRRMLKLSLILSICSMFWGVFTGSYFGLTVAPDSPLQKVSFLAYFAEKKADYHLRVKDDVYQEIAHLYPKAAEAQTGQEFLSTKVIERGSAQYPVFEDFSENLLMELSFLIGICHLSLSFFRYLTRNWAGLGWVFFMVGGYLYFPSIVNATTVVNFMGWLPKPLAYFLGFRCIFFGIGLAFVAALIKKKWGAFHELLHAVQVFADTLSYLRLYALALGGMVMAHTFNDALGLNPGIFATICIAFAGHVVNISLCLMGSVVHGLRLNFLEWFHYSFEGGGKLFNPLKLNIYK